MRRFITWQNIERYRRMLATEPDDARRQVVMKLLAEEEESWAGIIDTEASTEPNGQQAQAAPPHPKEIQAVETTELPVPTCERTYSRPKNRA